MQVLDRRKHGKSPKNCHVLDVPEKYLRVRKDDSAEWVAGRGLPEPEDRKLLREFEWRFPRSLELPCESVKSYPVDKFADEAAWGSEDELDLACILI